MGRGREDNPHMSFYDIDHKVLSAQVEDAAKNALLYETANGYHVISAIPIPELDEVADGKCPMSAVRVYPHTDFRFIHPPTRLCRQVLHIYASIFPQIDEANCEYIPCNQPLKFGVYNRPKPL